MFRANQQLEDVAKNIAAMNGPLVDVAKTSIETQLTVMTALGNAAFENLQKFIDLNVNASRASVEDSTMIARQLLAAKDPQEFLQIAVAQVQPAAAKAIAYSRHLASITADAQTKLARVAHEQVAETNRAVSTLVDTSSKNVPGGSDSAATFMKSTMVNANSAYEQFVQASQQAAKLMEANLTNAVNQVSSMATQAGSDGSTRQR